MLGGGLLALVLALSLVLALTDDNTNDTYVDNTVSTSTSTTSITTTTAAASNHHSVDQETAKALKDFHAYIQKFRKNYSDTEFEKRFAAFRAHTKRFDEINQNEKYTFKVGLTDFGDLTHDEFKAKFLGHRSSAKKTFLSPRPSDSLSSSIDTSALPASVNWNDAGAVTPVMQQGTCGSCWAFSTTGAIEGARKIKTGILTSLSQQELVACATSKYMDGCNGGNFIAAFTWVGQHGLDSERSYEYTSSGGQTGACKSSEGKLAITAAELTNYKQVDATDNLAMMAAVSQQPVSISIDAGEELQHYTGGIYNYACGTTENHAVLLIGYGSESGLDYWLIKNSWGTSWGEDGYFRMQRGSGSSSTGCYFFEAAYPIVTNASAPDLTPDSDSAHTWGIGFWAPALTLLQLLISKRQ